MNLFLISWSYIKGKPLNTFLNAMLLAMGIAIIVVLLLMSDQMKNGLERNAKGIDLVIGAKGSPLQLILSSIYHIDNPTGNIKLTEARKIAGNRRFVRNAVPLALGDSYREFRIVGTNSGYLEIYDGKIDRGNLWGDHLEVVLGNNVAQTLGMDVGSSFLGEHGLTTGGQSHDEHEYRVVGILSPSNTVLDNLILTSVESVWMMHAKSDEAHDHEEGEMDIFGLPLEDSDDLELTSLLIQYRGPRAAIQFPRMVNGNSALQAASPPFETARLFNLVGVGVEIIQGFAYIIILIAGLSVFIALYNSLKERGYDMAIMRGMGSTPAVLFKIVMIEGILITTFGGVLGFLFGHSVVEVLGHMMSSSNQVLITGKVFVFEEAWVAIFSVVLGIFASGIPAYQAYSADISNILAKG